MDVEAIIREEIARVVDVLAENDFYGGDPTIWPLTAAHGMSDREIDEALPRDIELPIVLRRYYRLCGRHPINATHNMLRNPSQLEVEQRKLIFLDENQGVVMWGIDESDRDVDDPEIWQTDFVTDDPLVWYPMEKTFTAFHAEMWRWTITAEEDI